MLSSLLCTSSQWLEVLISCVAGPNFLYRWGGGGGGFHWFVFEVVLVGSSADKRVHFHKSDLGIASNFRFSSSRHGNCLWQWNRLGGRGGGAENEQTGIPIRVLNECHETYEVQLLTAIDHFSRLIVNTTSSVDSREQVLGLNAVIPTSFYAMFQLRERECLESERVGCLSCKPWQKVRRLQQRQKIGVDIIGKW